MVEMALLQNISVTTTMPLSPLVMRVIRGREPLFGKVLVISAKPECASSLISEGYKNVCCLPLSVAAPISRYRTILFDPTEIDPDSPTKCKEQFRKLAELLDSEGIILIPSTPVKEGCVSGRLTPAVAKIARSFFRLKRIGGSASQPVWELRLRPVKRIPREETGHSPPNLLKGSTDDPQAPSGEYNFLPYSIAVSEICF